MSGQHQFEKTQFSQKSRTGQDADFYLREWEMPDEESDISGELLEGKIIARMPDLGESKKSGFLSPYQSSVRKLTHRIYYGLVFFAHIPKRTIRSFNSKPVFKKGFASRLIAVCLILLLIIGGSVWVHKSSRKKQKLARQTTTQKVESEGQAAKTEKSAQATPKPAASTEKPAEKPAAPVTPAKPATPPAAPVTPPAEKPAEKTAETSVAKAADKPADKAAASVAAPKIEEKKNSDSPWERPSTDNYSPWTMNSPERQQSNIPASGTERANVPANPIPVVNSPAPMASPNNSMVTMAPIAPINPFPSETAPAVATNYPPINYPVTANPVDQQRMMNNYPIAAPYTAAPGQPAMPTYPYHSAPNGTVTVYAQQQNVPIPQNYTPAYGRTDNYVPAPQGIPPYPPQPNMIPNAPRQPLPIQTGQVQYPIQYPAPSPYPVQYPATASYPPVYQPGMQEAGYGNGLPIPQAIAAQPPVNPVQNVAPQTYPTMYQQGNSPSPYRRLY